MDVLCVEIVLVRAGDRSVLSLCELLRCGAVHRRWREALDRALARLRALDFCGHETRISWHTWPRSARVLRRSTLRAAGRQRSCGRSPSAPARCATVAAGNAQCAWELAARGANVEASREDGASELALALLSHKTRLASSVRSRRAPRGSKVRYAPLSSTWPRPLSTQLALVRESATMPRRMCSWPKSGRSCRRRTWVRRSRPNSRRSRPSYVPSSAIAKDLMADRRAVTQA